MASEKKLLEKLKIIFDKAQATTSIKIFLLCAIDFLEWLQSIPQGNAIIKEIVDSAQKHLFIIDQKAAHASDELIQIKHHIQEYITTPQIKDILFDEFDAYDHPDPAKRISSTWHPLTSKRFILQGICDHIIRLGPKHYDFISQFTDVFCPINGRFGAAFAELKTPFFDDWNNAVKDYEEFKLDQIFYHWDIIASIYQTRLEGKKIITTLQNTNPLEALRLSQFHQKINEILMAPAESNISLDISLEELKYSFQKIWLFIEEKLQTHIAYSYVNQKEEDEPILSSTIELTQTFLSFDRISGLWIIDTYQIVFPKEKGSNGIIRPIIGVIVKYILAGKYQWSWDEIAEEIGSLPKNPNLIAKLKRRIHYAYIYINGAAIKQSNQTLQKLLDHNFNTCQVTPFFRQILAQLKK